MAGPSSMWCFRTCPTRIPQTRSDRRMISAYNRWSSWRVIHFMYKSHLTPYHDFSWEYFSACLWDFETIWPQDLRRTQGNFQLQFFLLLQGGTEMESAEFFYSSIKHAVQKKLEECTLLYLVGWFEPDSWRSRKKIILWWTWPVPFPFLFLSLALGVRVHAHVPPVASKHWTINWRPIPSRQHVQNVSRSSCRHGTTYWC